MTDPIETPYTREELLSAGDGFPERGLLCPKCHTRIPQFAELSEADRSRILSLCATASRCLLWRS